VVLIDAGPDFRAQSLREQLTHIDAVLYTHSHADHILGLDDLRPFSFKRGRIPLYADPGVSDVLKRIFEYTFSTANSYPHKAKVDLHPLPERLTLFEAHFIRVPVQHGKEMSAIAADDLVRLSEIFARIDEDPTIRVLVLTGTGDVLSVCTMLMHHRHDLAPGGRCRHPVCLP